MRRSYQRTPGFPGPVNRYSNNRMRKPVFESSIVIPLLLLLLLVCFGGVMPAVAEDIYTGAGTNLISGYFTDGTGINVSSPNIYGVTGYRNIFRFPLTG